MSSLPDDLPTRFVDPLAALVAGHLPADTVVAPAADSAALHSLNNDIRLAGSVSTGGRWVVRLPNTTTAAALGVVRSEELAAVRAAERAGLTPALVAADTNGILISEFVADATPFSAQRWAACAAGDDPQALDLLTTLGSTEPGTELPSVAERIERMRRGAGDAPIARDPLIWDAFAAIAGQRRAASV